MVHPSKTLCTILLLWVSLCNYVPQTNTPRLDRPTIHKLRILKTRQAAPKTVASISTRMLAPASCPLTNPASSFHDQRMHRTRGLQRSPSPTWLLDGVRLNADILLQQQSCFTRHTEFCSAGDCQAPARLLPVPLSHHQAKYGVTPLCRNTHTNTPIQGGPDGWEGQSRISLARYFV